MNLGDFQGLPGRISVIKKAKIENLSSSELVGLFESGVISRQEVRALLEVDNFSFEKQLVPFVKSDD